MYISESFYDLFKIFIFKLKNYKYLEKYLENFKDWSRGNPILKSFWHDKINK